MVKTLAQKNAEYRSRQMKSVPVGLRKYLKDYGKWKLGFLIAGSQYEWKKPKKIYAEVKKPYEKNYITFLAHKIMYEGDNITFENKNFKTFESAIKYAVQWMKKNQNPEHTIKIADMSSAEYREKIEYHINTVSSEGDPYDARVEATRARELISSSKLPMGEKMKYKKMLQMAIKEQRDHYRGN